MWGSRASNPRFLSFDSTLTGVREAVHQKVHSLPWVAVHREVHSLPYHWASKCHTRLAAHWLLTVLWKERGPIRPKLLSTSHTNAQTKFLERLLELLLMLLLLLRRRLRRRLQMLSHCLSTGCDLHEGT